MKPYHSTKFGDLYLGDCLEVMKELADNSIDLFFTSPPYNMKSGSGGFFNQKKGSGIWKNAELINGYDGHDDNMDYKEYCNWQQKCLQEMHRLRRNNGAIFYNHKWRIQNHQLLDRTEITKSFKLREIIIWDKNMCVNYNLSHLPGVYEVIYNFAGEDFRYIDKGQNIQNVLRIAPAKNNKHPAPFPVELPSKIISKTNAKIIADPFGGSGTTAIACIQNKRKYILIEKSEKYCKMAKDRIENELHKQRLF